MENTQLSNMCHIDQKEQFITISCRNLRRQQNNDDVQWTKNGLFLFELGPDKARKQEKMPSSCNYHLFYTNTV